MSSHADIRLAAAERRTQVSELYLHGYSTRTIAARFGVSHQSIVKDLAIISREWQEQRLDNREAYVAAELERLASVERAAWEGYERSQDVSKRRVAERTEAETGDKKRTQIVEVDRDGSAQWLAVVLSCITQRRALLGLDQPIKVDQTTTIVDPFAQIPADRQAELVDQANRSRASLRCLEGGASG